MRGTEARFVIVSSIVTLLLLIVVLVEAFAGLDVTHTAAPAVVLLAAVPIQCGRGHCCWRVLRSRGADAAVWLSSVCCAAVRVNSVGPSRARPPAVDTGLHGGACRLLARSAARRYY